jgi:hypothetical protein
VAHYPWWRPIHLISVLAEPRFDYAKIVRSLARRSAGIGEKSGLKLRPSVGWYLSFKEFPYLIENTPRLIVHY